MAPPRKKRLLQRDHDPADTKKVPIKANKPFDWSKWSTRKIALKLAYVGWDYIGFTGLDEDRSIEYNLFEALEKSKLIKSRHDVSLEYSRCGRTDRGVSAMGNVISLRVRSRLVSGPGITPPAESPAAGVKYEGDNYNEHEYPYISMLNSILPADIRITGWAPVPLDSPDFSARFSCLSRTYHYYFFVGTNRDVERMREAAEMLVGNHDFRNFAKIDLNKKLPSFERQISSCTIERATDASAAINVYRLVIRGTGFLWHMVRNIMSVLLWIGDGFEEPSVMSDLLDIVKVPDKPSYEMASDRHLVLFDCEFPTLEWNESPDGLDKVIRVMDEMWMRHSVDMSMIGEMRNAIMHSSTSSIPFHRVKAKHSLLLSRATRDSMEVHKMRIERKAEKKGKKEKEEEEKLQQEKEAQVHEGSEGNGKAEMDIQFQ